MFVESLEVSWEEPETRDFGTILTAASWPVTLCFARRTLPEEPRPRVRPSRQGPMWVLVRLEAEEVEVCERRFWVVAVESSWEKEAEEEVFASYEG